MLKKFGSPDVSLSQYEAKQLFERRKPMEFQEDRNQYSDFSLSDSEEEFARIAETLPGLFFKRGKWWCNHSTWQELIANSDKNKVK